MIERIFLRGQNPHLITTEQIGLLYAWNENGEGAWLTPGKTG